MDHKTRLAELLALKTGLFANELADMLEVPPESSMGDLALPCFKLAKTMRMAPPKIANELLGGLTLPEGFSRAEVVGGYLNFYFERESFSSAVLEAAQKEGYGSSREGEDKTIVIDYSSVNIAKPFHIGHLSTTALGNSLYKIYEYLGYKCVGVNHLGDWGTQFGKLISAYKRWGNKEDIEKGSIREMLKLYVRFHDEAEANPALNDEARHYFKLIEDGDEEALSIFTWFKELTLKEVGKVYELLGVKFDSYAGESFYNDKMQPVIDELREKGLLEESDGASVVRLDEENLPPCLILKRDGSTLYATRDLAAAFYRKKTYDFHKALYVVAYQQNLHFKQWFAVVKKMGYPWAEDLEHVAFGMVSLENGTLSTRAGRVVFLEEVLAQAIEKTAAVMDEKSPELENREEIARQIGVGAVVFSVLSSGRIKDIVFNIDKVLNFDGETGPYVQYTHARSASLMRRAPEGWEQVAPDYSALSGDIAYGVIKLLAGFPEAVRKACEKNEPSVITRQTLDICKAFNRFYYDVRVIDEDKAKTAARLALTRACKNAVKTGLMLLGIAAPDKM